MLSLFTDILIFLFPSLLGALQGLDYDISLRTELVQALTSLLFTQAQKQSHASSVPLSLSSPSPHSKPSTPASLRGGLLKPPNSPHVGILIGFNDNLQSLAAHIMLNFHALDLAPAAAANPDRSSSDKDDVTGTGTQSEGSENNYTKELKMDRQAIKDRVEDLFKIFEAGIKFKLTAKTLQQVCIHYIPYIYISLYIYKG